MNSEAKRAAIYARVSSDRQDVDLSISAQLKALREYAARNGYTVVREFVDEAETGRSSMRPAFREMVSLARKLQKPFDIILVWKYSRFARSREDSIVYKAMLRKNGIQVVSINEAFDDTPTGRLLEAIIESLDEFYSDNLGEEVVRGMRESASRGFYLSGKPPYGYKKVRVRDGTKDRVRLELDAYQAKIVSSIFSEILNGKGLIEIAKALNTKGIASSNGKGWGKTGIRTILSNEVYMGTSIWGRRSRRGLQPIRVLNAYPAIVDRDTFEQVQNTLRNRAPVLIHPKRTASRFLLSGLAKCGHCGKALVGQDAKSGQFSYYVCGTLVKKGTGSCQMQYLNSRKFEAAVVEKIKERILTEENLTCLVELVNEEMDGTARTHKEELVAVLEEIADVNRRLARLYDSLETGKVELGDLAPRIKELRTRQEKLLATKVQLETSLSDRRVELASPDIVRRYAADLRNLLTRSELAERKAFIRRFIKEVRVTGDEVVLTYTMPLIPNGSTADKIGVLPIVQHGRPCRSRTCDTLIKRYRRFVPKSNDK